MAKATLLILIAVAAGLLVYLFVAPGFVHDKSNREPQSQENVSTPLEPSPGDIPDPDSPRSVAHFNSESGSVGSPPPIDVPLTNEQRSQKDLEARRGPVYAWIKANMSEVLVGWQPSTADPATLNLYMARSDSSDLLLCMNKLVEPYATRYGFNHVSFFEPNPPDVTDHWRLDSEATPDSGGSWHLYRK